MQKLVLIGAGGHARDVLDVVEALNSVTPHYEMLGYIVEREYGTAGELMNGHPILGDFAWLAENESALRAGTIEMICALGQPELRLRMVTQALIYGARFATLVHPQAIVTPHISPGIGTVILAGAVLTNSITVGAHVQINVGCTVSHDVTLNDYATLSPGAHIAGRVIIGTGCYVGIGASVIDKVKVGAWSIIGAGCAVVRDVPPDTTVVGVPGRVIKTRAAGWQNGGN